MIPLSDRLTALNVAESHWSFTGQLPQRAMSASTWLYFIRNNAAVILHITTLKSKHSKIISTQAPPQVIENVVVGYHINEWFLETFIFQALLVRNID